VPPRPKASAPAWVLAALGTALVALLAAAAVLTWESTTRAFDAHTEMQIVERTARLGGTYYTTGADQKGPLWLGTYSVARTLFGHEHAWYGVALLLLLVTTTTILALWAIGRLSGPSREGAAAVTAIAATAMAFNAEEWSGVLYSRNLVIALSSCAFAAVFAAGAAQGRRRMLLLLAAGFCTGLAVQTNPSSAVTALVISALAVWLVVGKVSSVTALRRRGPTVAVFFGAAAFTFVSAFLWYAARGALRPFWEQWYTYNQFYTEATGLSGLDVLQKGLRDFRGYYADHTVSLLVLGTFTGDALRRLRAGGASAVDLALPAWWAAEVLAVVASQRFFPHYLILPTVPVLAMAIVLGARYGELLTATARRTAMAAALAAALLVVYWAQVGGALTRLRDYSGTDAVTAARVAALAPDRQRLRDEVARRSSFYDYVYVHNIYPFIYTEIDRVSATRFIESRWLYGYIYGGGTSADYVLPDTWTKWREDMRRTPPKLIALFEDQLPPPDSPAQRLIDCAYTKVWEEPSQRLYERTAAVEPCLEPTAAELTHPIYGK
jgi:hypothetical protein